MKQLGKGSTSQAGLLVSINVKRGEQRPDERERERERFQLVSIRCPGKLSRAEGRQLGVRQWEKGGRVR